MDNIAKIILVAEGFFLLISIIIIIFLIFRRIKAKKNEDFENRDN